MRANDRKFDEMRPVKIISQPSRHAEGSAEIYFGHTRVLVTASIQNSIPKWLKQSGQGGWISAEYNMLPRSTNTRISRKKSLEGGRTKELSRLIGRSLRSCVDLTALGERQILIDCDVIEADGGTRTAAVSGGFVALSLALKQLQDKGDLSHIPLHHGVQALSVGLTPDQHALLDLDYEEDSSISTDLNFVFTHTGALIEIQGTAEKQPFSEPQLLEMLQVARKGQKTILEAQKAALPFLHIWP